MRKLLWSIAAMILILSVYNCSSDSDQDYYNSGMQNISDGNISEAVTNFKALLDEFPESRLAAKSYFELGKLHITEKNYDEALMSFENVINKFPDSSYAPSAMYEIGRLYHGRAIKNLSPAKSLQKGVEYYKKVFDEYPESPEAPNALFMAGFLLANELNDLETARSYYQLFIEKFPQSDLYDDAKSELDNLGKSPEEILNSKKEPVN